MFRFVDKKWGKEISDALHTNASDIRIICPFIKKNAIEQILEHSLNKIQVITRFNLTDFAEGVSDITALRELLDAGADIRGIKNLHAKIYLFGDRRAIVTSANLTKAALERNHEFGLIAEDESLTEACRDYFDKLWNRAGKNLTSEQLGKWDKEVASYFHTRGQVSKGKELEDFGADIEEGEAEQDDKVASKDERQEYQAGNQDNDLLNSKFWQKAKVDDLVKSITSVADINAFGVNRLTPLHLAAKHSEKPEVLGLLLDKGADINARDNSRDTPLHVAAEHNKIPEVVALLLDRDGDIEVRNKHGETPLHLAVYNKTLEVVSLLLDKGADIESCDEYGRTPLHWAAEYNKTPEVISLLLNRGANIRRRDHFGDTPLYKATRLNQTPEVVSLLSDREEKL